MSGGNGDADFAAFDHYFHAMSHHRLGDVDKAREYFARAVRGHEEKEKGLSELYLTELKAFRVVLSSRRSFGPRRRQSPG
jgi:hypothetical protein